MSSTNYHFPSSLKIPFFSRYREQKRRRDYWLFTDDDTARSDAMHFANHGQWKWRWKSHWKRCRVWRWRWQHRRPRAVERIAKSFYGISGNGCKARNKMASQSSSANKNQNTPTYNGNRRKQKTNSWIGNQEHVKKTRYRKVYPKQGTIQWQRETNGNGQ